MMSGLRLAAPATPGLLTIDRRNDSDGVTLVVRGELDIASAPALERALDDAQCSLPRRIVLDLAALDFLDSTGIHLMIHAQERARANGHRLVVTNVPAHAQRLFELTRITAHLNIQ